MTFRRLQEVLNGGPFYTVHIDGVSVTCASVQAALDLIAAHKARVEAERDMEIQRERMEREQAAQRVLVAPTEGDTALAALALLSERQGQLVPVDELVSKLKLRSGRGLSAIQRTVTQRLHGHPFGAHDVIRRQRVEGHRYWTAGPRIGDALRVIQGALTLRASPATGQASGDVIDGKTGKVRRDSGKPRESA